MNKLYKSLFALLLAILSTNAFSAANELGYYESEEEKKAGQLVIAKEIQEIKDFVARDNALTQKFVKDKNSKPFIDERKESEQIDFINNRLWAKHVDFGEKETVIEMIKAEENFIRNLDIKWDLAKQRGYFDLEKTTPIFNDTRNRNETKLIKLKQKLARL